MSKEVRKTKTAIERLGKFHALYGAALKCEWAVYRAEVAELLQIDIATIDALRAMGAYLHTDDGLRYAA